MTYLLHRGGLDQVDVQALLAVHVAAMHAQSPPDSCHVLPADALAVPEIAFFTVRDDCGGLLGIGALKALGVDAGEIKSMRTAPHATGRGVGRFLLDALIAEARARNYHTLLLETGRTADFAAAIHLYERAGFVPGEPFSTYRASNFTRFFQLDLRHRLASLGAPC